MILRRLRWNISHCRRSLTTHDGNPLRARAEFGAGSGSNVTPSSCLRWDRRASGGAEPGIRGRHFAAFLATTTIASSAVFLHMLSSYGSATCDDAQAHQSPQVDGGVTDGELHWPAAATSGREGTPVRANLQGGADLSLALPDAAVAVVVHSQGLQVVEKELRPDGRCWRVIARNKQTGLIISCLMEQKRSDEAYGDSRAPASSSVSSESAEIPPEWEVSPASVPCRERMEGCQSRVLEVLEAKRSSGELQVSLPKPSSRSVPNGYLLEYVKVESSPSQRRARRRRPSTKPPTQSRADSASESESKTTEGKAWRNPGKEGTTPSSGGGVSDNATGTIYQEDGSSSRSDAPTALTLSRNARLFLDFEEGVSLDVHLHLPRYGEFEGRDKRVLQSLFDGIEVILGYEHSAAEHLAFGTYFYYRGKRQVRGGGSGAPLPPGSTRSAEEAGAMSRWARAAEREDAVQRAFMHFQKASLMNHYGVLASARSGLQKASAVFEQAVRKEPSNAKFRYNLACVRAEMGEKEGMLEELERALVLQSRGKGPESKLVVNPSKDLAFRDFWQDPDFRRLVDMYESIVSC